MSRLPRVVALLVLLGVILPPPPGCGAPAPVVDTSGMEPAVRQLIEDRRSGVAVRDDAASWGALGDALLAHGLAADAAPCYERAAERATELDVDPFEWLYLKALALQAEPGRIEQALATYERAGSLRPNDALVPLRIGLLLQATGRHAEAIVALERAVATDASLQRARRALGQERMALDRLDGAIAALQEAVRLEPVDGAGWSALAQAYRATGRADASRDAATRAARGREIEGFEDPLWRRHVFAAGVSAARRFDRALYALSQGELDAARGHVVAILEVRADSADAHFLLGRIETARGNLAEAESHFLRAVDADADHGRSLQALAALARERGDLEPEYQWLQRASDATPRDPSLLTRLIENRSRAGDLDGVERIYLRLAELQPGRASIWLDLGTLYTYREQWDRAAESLREAIRLQPDLAVAHERLAEVQDARAASGLTPE